MVDRSQLSAGQQWRVVNPDPEDPPEFAKGEVVRVVGHTIAGNPILRHHDADRMTLEAIRAAAWLYYKAAAKARTEGDAEVENLLSDAPHNVGQTVNAAVKAARQMGWGLPVDGPPKLDEQRR